MEISPLLGFFRSEGSRLQNVLIYWKFLATTIFMGNLFWPHKVIIYQQNLEVLYILQADQVPGQACFAHLGWKNRTRKLSCFISVGAMGFSVLRSILILSDLEGLCLYTAWVPLMCEENRGSWSKDGVRIDMLICMWGRKPINDRAFRWQCLSACIDSVTSHYPIMRYINILCTAHYIS